MFGRRRNEPVEIAESSTFDDIRTCHGYSSWALALFKQAPGLNRALTPHVLVFPHPNSFVI